MAHETKTHGEQHQEKEKSPEADERDDQTPEPQAAQQSRNVLLEIRDGDDLNAKFRNYSAHPSSKPHTAWKHRALLPAPNDLIITPHPSPHSLYVSV